jgi:hypothetical protein
MGLEAKCRVRHGGQSAEGTARLETGEIVFRGTFRLKIPVGELKTIEARNGELHVGWGGDRAVFELGKATEKWADKILHPPSLTDKLGVKAGMKVGLVGQFEQAFVGDVGRRVAEVSTRVKKNSDLILMLTDTKAALDNVSRLAPSLASRGALWIVYPKGRKTITENDVLAAGRAAGLVDIKVASFSATHTALKFVIPVSKRQQ